jgi:hypothetical protein
MFGPPLPNPYEGLIFALLFGTTAILLVGAVRVRRWSQGQARVVRLIAVSLALVVPAAWEILSPAQHPIERAARLVSVWPLVLVNLLLFGIWTWRARRRG